MKFRQLMTAITVVVAVATVDGCTKDATGPVELTELGAISVWLNMMGNTPDPDGCLVQVSGRPPTQILAGQVLTFPDLDLGATVVSLTDVEAYCSLGVANPQTVTVSPGQTTEVKFDVTCGSGTPPADVAGMDVLGSGYNVTGNYADIADVKAAVLDLAALNRAEMLRLVQYERATYHVVSGKTSTEYASSFAAKVGIEGSVGAFSGAVKASFKSDRYTSKNYSFATVQSIIRKNGLRVALYVTPEELRTFLVPAAQEAINDATIEPDTLFKYFGTHVLTGIIVGGRLDFSTSANMSFEKQDRSIDVYARASFKSVFGSASIEAQATSDLSWSEYSASEEKHLEVYGGRSEYGQYIMNEGVYESWIESVHDNSVMIDFERNGLTPIWQLADDQQRRTELNNGWLEYAEAHGITLEGEGPIISNFEDNVEGWTFTSGFEEYADPVRLLMHGWFGSYIVGREDGGSWLNFVAPAKFLGDKSVYQGGTLEYILFYAEESPTGSMIDVVFPAIIFSANGNLYYRESIWDVHPPGDFTARPYIIPLKDGVQDDSTGGRIPGQWERWDGTPADASDIFLALSNVVDIWITGNFYDGRDVVALDKVSLNPPPPPPTP